MSADRIFYYIENSLSQASKGVGNARERYQSGMDEHGVPQLNETCTGRSLQSLRLGMDKVEGVRKIWFEHLVPQLQNFEHARAAAKLAYKRKSTPIKVACILGGLAGFYVMGIFGPVIAFAAYSFATKDVRENLNKHGQKAKHLLVSAACEVFGFTYHPGEIPSTSGPQSGSKFGQLFSQSGLYQMAKGRGKAGNAECPTPALEIMQRYGLFKKPDRTTFDDGVSGDRAGAKFSMIETHLQRYEGSGKNRRLATVFRGILIHIDYPRNFLGETVICRKGKGKRIARKHNLGVVDIIANEFEDRFDVCSNDQTEARFLLTPDRLLRLIALDNYFQNGDLQAVFEDGHLTLAISTPDLFEVGDAWNGLVDQSRFADCLHHLQMICDVLDGYLTREWSKGKV